MRPVDAPVSSWGLIIGKGGATLKRLQEEFGVRIVVPPPNMPGDVTIHGSGDACDRCAAEIRKIVNSIQRGKDVAKNKRQNHQQHNAVDKPYPEKCTLCGCATSSLATAFDHLGSKGHLRRMLESDPGLACEFVQSFASVDGPIDVKPLSVLQVVGMLSASDLHADFHSDLGFDVSELVRLSDKEHKRRELLKSTQLEASRFTPDLDWLRVESRHVLGWDDTEGEGATPLTKAPELSDIQMRCHLEYSTSTPPLIRVPKLPAALPRMDPAKRKSNLKKARHMYPFTPDAGRLGVAVIKNLNLDLSTYDLTCGTSFIKSLCGETEKMKDEFYLQRVPGTNTIVSLHVPPRTHDSDDVGHAVERVLCGNGYVGKNVAAGCFVCATTAVIGDSTRVLICSEVDASDSDGRVVELKSSSTKRGKEFVSSKVALQVLVNGSDFVLGCHLNRDKSHLEGVEWLSRDDIKQGHKTGLIAAGQRIRLVLPRVLADFAEICRGLSDVVVRMTFDDSKMPVLAVADTTRVEVLPHGLF